MQLLRSAESIFHLLLENYGYQYWWPVFQNGRSVYQKANRQKPRSKEHQWEIALGAILTQNTSWHNVEKAFASLAQAGGWEAARITSLSIEELAQNIRPAGYHNQKAKKIQQFLKIFPGGDLSTLSEKNIEDSRQQLLQIWGIGPESADSILLYALGFETFVVDTYTRRLFSRLSLVKSGATYTEIQAFFHSNLDSDLILFQEYHALIVQHAKKFCRARPLCESCFLSSDCRFSSFQA